MKLFLPFLLISSLLISSSGRSQSFVCVDRFDPTSNDFTFKIRSTDADCKSNERLLEIKKRSPGIWLFFPLQEQKEESFDKFSSDQKE